MRLKPRQEKILFCLLQEFIAQAKPVGSKILCQKYKLEWCPATVRNVMSDLEEMGYLYQLHPSAGRLPSLKAYRYYVDHLLEQNLSVPYKLKEKVKFDHRIQKLEELLENVADILANLTRFTSLVLVPRARQRVLRYLSIDLIGENSLLLVVLTTTGFVATRIVKLSSPVEPGKIRQLTSILNEKLRGHPLSGASEIVMGQVLSEAEFLRLSREFFLLLSSSIKQIARQAHNQVFLRGKDYLFDLPEFQDISKLKKLLRILEEEQVVAETLSQSLGSPGVQVKMGEELCFNEIKECAVITAPYSVGSEAIGRLGILGPLRMPYARLIPMVDLIAESFSHRLSYLKR